MSVGRRRALLVGLDGADSALVERWMADGSLPTLARMRREGCWGRLSTSARHLAGSPWPTFYTGRPPSDHGIHHEYQWRHERMRYARPDPEWIPARPFWRALSPDVRVVAYDVPMVQACESFPGVELSGWASHDRLGPPDAWPREVGDEARRRFGAWNEGLEEFGPAGVRKLLRVERSVIESFRYSARVARWLLERPWDLGIAVLGGLHRGGHRLFDRSSLGGRVPADLGERFDRALHGIYQAADSALASILESAGDATVLVFALHGMMENTARVDFLDEMLARALLGRPREPRRPGALRRLGEAMPLPLRRFLTRNMPRALHDFLMTSWSAGGIDWAATPAFTLRADLQGYIRINRKGREPRGIVAPGAEEDALCARIAEGLSSFRDSRTGAPIVREVVRIEGLYPAGERRDRLPDLIVLWDETPARHHEAIESPALGRIERSTPGRIPNARSGNHRPEGWVLGRGPGIRSGGELRPGADILDLAPTVLEILGAATSAPLAGKVLAELVGAGGRS